MKFFAAFFVVALTVALPHGSALAVEDGLSAAANQAFLIANARKDGVVSRPNGLQYHMLRSGFGNRPGPGDSVQAQFSARLINGTVFDGTSPGLPATLSVNGVLRGLSEALQLMHTGDHWQIIVPPNLAFGARGSDNGTVPPNQVLVFDLTLLSILPVARTANAGPGISIAPINKLQGSVREQGAMLTIPQ